MASIRWKMNKRCLLRKSKIIKLSTIMSVFKLIYIDSMIPYSWEKSVDQKIGCIWFLAFKRHLRTPENKKYPKVSFLSKVSYKCSLRSSLVLVLGKNSLLQGEVRKISQKLSVLNSLKVPPKEKLFIIVTIKYQITWRKTQMISCHHCSHHLKIL